MGQARLDWNLDLLVSMGPWEFPFAPLSAAFSPETTDDRKKRHNTFKVLKEKHSQLRILYLAKIPFKNKDTDTLRGKKTKENS